MRSIKVLLIIFILFASIALQNSLAIEENSRTINLRGRTNNEKIHQFENYQNMNNQFDLNLQNNPYPSENFITNWEPRGINPDSVDPAAFVSYWDTSLTTSGSSSSTQIKLPLESSGTYNLTVYWGDGLSNTITTWNDPAVTHSYSTSDVYNITITDTIIGWSFHNDGDVLKLMEIAQWGDLRLGNSGSYFQGSSNLRLTTNDTLDLTGTTSLSLAFSECNSLGSTGNLNSWDVSQVTDMYEMFASYRGSSFNQPLNSWDVSHVNFMADMFRGASSFNQPLNSWDVSHVTSMGYMFYSASSFNQPIGNWNVSQVTDMYEMFAGASSFNQPLNNWDVSQVNFMGEMFYKASSFNQPLNNWDVSHVTNMYGMFNGASSFNQSIGNWNVSQVTYMNKMFYQVNLSISNYDNILTGWSALNLQHGITFDAGYSKYSKTVGEPARMYIIDTFGWSILDGGVYTPPTTTTPPTSTTSSTSTTPTTNPIPFSWITLIALPILGVMVQYKRETRKN